MAVMRDVVNNAGEMRDAHRRQYRPQSDRWNLPHLDFLVVTGDTRGGDGGGHA